MELQSIFDVGVVGVASVLMSALAVAVLVGAAIVSHFEREPRATGVFLLLAVLLPLPYFAATFLEFRGQAAIAVGLLVIPVACVLVLLLPIGKKTVLDDTTPRSRVDERDIMFSRKLLEPGTQRFRDYYAANRDKKPWDDEFRAKPGLLAEGTTAYHPYGFRAADASFWTIERLRPFVDGEPSTDKVDVSPVEVTSFLKRWALKLGAVSVGMTKLRDYHLYSVVGRGEQYGEPVILDHGFALALTVEMDKAMIDRAPLAPTVMESAQQYVESGVIAVQLADFIRRLGYQARAHIDGNYRVVCPLVARDAGLGEIGRMGLLMTPRLGPRVRTAVVTTDLALVTDERLLDGSVIDFCSRCKKCAAACPSNAIPFSDRREIGGVRRWQINQEACYTFWCHVGTDCARCVKVCPYSHPDNLLHNGVRWGVRRSALFRKLAVTMDDVFYGKQPRAAKLQDWMGP
jgi:ferredoxin